MITVTLIGTGALAKNLFNAINASDHARVRCVIGRDKKALSYFKATAISEDFNTPIDSDIVFLAVADPSIKEVYQKVKSPKAVFVHSAGSVPLSVFDSDHNTGVFYPLQTFNSKTTVPFAQVPIGIEANDSSTRQLLEKLAHGLSERVINLSSEDRKQLHLAAVFANNFSNHLFAIAQDLCTQKGLSVDLLSPLIEQTSKNVLSFTAAETQSGPAKRKDLKRIQEHLSMLKDPSHKEIYQLLSQSILKKYKDEL